MFNFNFIHRNLLRPIILLSFFISFTTCENGKSLSREKRLIGGIPIERLSVLPSVGAAGLGTIVIGQTGFCIGVLISPQYFVHDTSSCSGVTDFAKAFVSLASLIAPSTAAGTGEIYPITNKITFVPGTNFEIVQLAKPASFPSLAVPATLPISANIPPPTGTKCKIFGFSLSNTVLTNLNSLDIVVTDLNQCAENWSKASIPYVVKKDSQFCANFVNPTGKSPICRGDLPVVAMCENWDGAQGAKRFICKKANERSTEDVEKEHRWWGCDDDDFFAAYVLAGFSIIQNQFETSCDGKTSLPIIFDFTGPIRNAPLDFQGYN